MRRKKKTRSKNGHRQELTRVMVESISIGKTKTAKTKATTTQKEVKTDPIDKSNKTKSSLKTKALKEPTSTSKVNKTTNKKEKSSTQKVSKAKES